MTVQSERRSVLSFLEVDRVWRQRQGKQAYFRIVSVDPRIAALSLTHGDMLRNQPRPVWVEIERLRFDGETFAPTGDRRKVTGGNMLSSFHPIDRDREAA